MEEHKNVWCRIAGNARCIKDGGEFGWRISFGETEEILLKSFVLSGSATPATNNNPDWSKDGNEQGHVAWIDFYGDVTITSEGVATIFLKNPE